MHVPLHTLMYSADKAGIDELYTLRQDLSCITGKEFKAESYTDDKCIKKNINLIVPEEKWKVERLIQIAEDDGIQYMPTEGSQEVIHLYISLGI